MNDLIQFKHVRFYDVEKNRVILYMHLIILINVCCFTSEQFYYGWSKSSECDM